MYNPLIYCRACGSSDLRAVFDLGVQPLANDFCTADQERAGWAPLKVLLCEQCTLAQLSVVVRPDILYSNYPYVTSTSQMMTAHFDHLIGLLKQRPHRSVLEIGSNDGGFLKHCKQNGITEVVGIDPAENLAQAANSDGIQTITGTFDYRTASMGGPRHDLVVARHVFCHVDDWDDFIENLALVTHENSTVLIEVPYVMDMLERVEFDTIYHEHTSYLSIRAMTSLLKDTPWAIEKVERFSIHGGAVGLFLRRSGPVDSDGIEALIKSENRIPELWGKFQERAFEQAASLAERVYELNYDGQIVCGFGASAKSTVLINACKFTKSDIKFICDCTPSKIGRTSPGSEIPIVPEDRLADADCSVLFAWNFATEIMKRQRSFIEKGGRFILPVTPPGLLPAL